MEEANRAAAEAVDPDRYALDVLNIILGSGRTSRLYQEVVEARIAGSADAGVPDPTRYA